MHAIFATAPDAISVYTAAIRAAELRVPQRGVWHDKDKTEWEYYFHGKGCLLTNKVTGEEINWNCPNVQAFNAYFFEPHLAWQLANPMLMPLRQHLAAWLKQHNLRSIQTLIDELIEENRILPGMTLPPPS